MGKLNPVGKEREKAALQDRAQRKKSESDCLPSALKYRSRSRRHRRRLLLVHFACLLCVDSHYLCRPL